MKDKALVWLHGEVKSPPFSKAARIQAGFLLRNLQCGSLIEMPASRPMPSVGANCHELRLRDSEVGKTWRIIYQIDKDAIVILEVFPKKTQTTPRQVIQNCKRRLKAYAEITQKD